MLNFFKVLSLIEHSEYGNNSCLDIENVQCFWYYSNGLAPKKAR